MAEQATAGTNPPIESPTRASASPRSPIEAQAAIEAEEDDYNDSAYDGDTLASSTTSIGSSVLKYREENGRTYHAYKVPMPS